MRTSDVITSLQNTIEDLKRAQQIEPIQPGITIKEAYQKLRHIVPDTRALFVGVELKHYGKGIGGPPDIEFEVWDGADHFKGPNLATCVQACIDRHAPPAVDAVQVIDQNLESITAREPIPF